MSEALYTHYKTALLKHHKRTNGIPRAKHTESLGVAAGEVSDDGVRIRADVAKYNAKAQGSAHGNPDSEREYAQEDQEAAQRKGYEMGTE